MRKCIGGLQDFNNQINPEIFMTYRSTIYNTSNNEEDDCIKRVKKEPALFMYREQFKPKY